MGQRALSATDGCLRAPLQRLISKCRGTLVVGAVRVTQQHPASSRREAFCLVFGLFKNEGPGRGALLANHDAKPLLNMPQASTNLHPQKDTIQPILGRSKTKSACGADYFL